MPSPEAITIIAPRGLGDACVCLPACYEYVHRGIRVNLRNAGATNFAETLPTLVPLGTDLEGDVIDISGGLSFHSEYRMFAQVSLRTGIFPLAFPEEPWLRKPPEYADTVAALGVPDDYILICPEGSQHNRRMSTEQIAALAERWPVVVSFDRELPDLPGVNLTGKTTLTELYALTAQARAVVAPDTGTLHLAAAFGTPLLAVIGKTLNPYSFCLDYNPSLWLVGDDAWTIDPQDCVDGLIRLLSETV